MNKAKVDVGQSPPLDLVSAQAEVAADQEQLIIAETAVKVAEDRLRMLIFDPTAARVWTVKIEPIDSPPIGDAGARHRRGRDERLERSRRPAARPQGHRYRCRRTSSSPATSGCPTSASTRAIRRAASAARRCCATGGFPGTVVGRRRDHRFRVGAQSAVQQQLPDVVGRRQRVVSASARARRTPTTRARSSSVAQSEQRLKSAEASVIQQIRTAGWKIEMNAKRIETTRAARELAEQRLDAEQKRFEVGMSTNFLVIQAQRDLAQAKTNELSAILAYDAVARGLRGAAAGRTRRAIGEHPRRPPPPPTSARRRR